MESVVAIKCIMLLVLLSVESEVSKAMQMESAIKLFKNPLEEIMFSYNFSARNKSCSKIICAISLHRPNLDITPIVQAFQENLCTEVTAKFDTKGEDLNQNVLKDSKLNNFLNNILPYYKTTLYLFDSGSNFSFLNYLQTPETRSSFSTILVNQLRLHKFSGIQLSFGENVHSPSNANSGYKDMLVNFVNYYAKLSRGNNWTFDVGLTYPFDSYLDGASVIEVGLSVRYLIFSIKSSSGQQFAFKQDPISITNLVQKLEDEFIEMNNVLVSFPAYGRFEKPFHNDSGSDLTEKMFHPNIRNWGNLTTHENPIISYADICHMISNNQSGFELYVNNFTDKALLMNTENRIDFETPSSLIKKAKFLMSAGIQGFQIDDLQHDDFEGQQCGITFPILRSLATTDQFESTCDKVDLPDIGSSEHQANHKNYLLLAGSVSTGCVMLAICGIIIYWHWQATKTKRSGSPQAETLIEIPTSVHDFEIPADDFELNMSSLIGQGNFNVLIQGRYKGQKVVVKISKSGSGNKHATQRVINELKILHAVQGHKNIVSFIGYSLKLANQSLKVYLFLDLCPLGSVDIFLKARRNVFIDYVRDGKIVNNRKQVVNGVACKSDEIPTTKTLISWILQVCEGMEFIASKNIVHGDLAARNVLVKTMEEVKLCDFELSCNLGSSKPQEFNTEGQLEDPIPWRWMAVECLEQNHVHQNSDIWSYGVTLWEIFTLGEIPYAGLEWNLDFLNKIRNGVRLPQPLRAPNDIYEEIILPCWNAEWKNRPSFSKIKQQILNKIYTMISEEYDDISGAYSETDVSPISECYV